MPYSHAGEIGDVWKHLPLCEMLGFEKPKRYFETNSASAKHSLPNDSRKEYGVFHLMSRAASPVLDGKYFDVLRSADTLNSRIYLGSPAQAMKILSDEAVYFFHDIEQMPLHDIRDFAISVGLADRVNTVCGDSISAFLDGGYEFTSSDLVFIDPYQPFDANASGQNYFDVFTKAYTSQSKTVLWYGYDSIKGKQAIAGKLRRIREAFDCGAIYTFDIWQRCMGYDGCARNPGVPGCGLAIAHLSEASIAKTGELLRCVEDIYKEVLYNGSAAPISTDHSII